MRTWSQRCDHCPLGRQPPKCAEKGLLIRRVLDLISALRLAVHIGLDEICGTEFCAMLIIAEERHLLERERLPGSTDRRAMRVRGGDFPESAFREFGKKFRVTKKRSLRRQFRTN